MSTKTASHPSPGQNGEPKLSLGVIFLTLYIDLVGFSIIFPLFPAMLKYYLHKEGQTGFFGNLVVTLQHISQLGGHGNAYMPVLFGGFLGSLYSVLQFFFAPIWGGLSDRFGRRHVLMITTLGTALSYLLWVFSGSFLLLIGARLFGGAMSGNLSVATASVADVTTKENRAKGMGLIGAAFGLGFVTGPAIGGIAASWNLLGAHSHWSAFGINPFSVPALAALVMALVNFVWISTRFKESLPKEKRAHDHAVASRNPISALRRPQPVPVKKTNWVYFIFILAFSGMEFTLSFLADHRFDFKTSDITWMMIYIGFILILVQGGIVRRVAPKYGERRVAMAGLVCVTLGFIALSLAPDPVWLYVGLTVLATGAGLATPSLTALVSLYTPPDKQGQALGTFRSLGSLARAVGPIAASILFWWQNSQFSYAVGAVMVIVSLLLGFRLPVPES